MKWGSSIQPENGCAGARITFSVRKSAGLGAILFLAINVQMSRPTRSMPTVPAEATSLVRFPRTSICIESGLCLDRTICPGISFRYRSTKQAALKLDPRGILSIVLSVQEKLI